MESDFLPATDGLFLGETTTPRRWDASKLINLVETQIPVLTDAKYPNALLLDGSRAMTGNLNLGGKLLDFGDNVVLRLGVADNSVRITDKLNTVYRPLYCAMISIEKMYSTANNFIFRTNTETGKGIVSFQSFNGTDWLEAARLGTLNQFDATFHIPRAGDITLLDDKFLKIGKDSDGTLPTPDASYRGKMIRVEGSVGVADEVYICKWNGTAYKWFKINMTEI